MSKQFFPVFDEQKFGEDIGRILDKFQFSGEVRRKIFSQIMEYATEQAGNPKKGNQK